VGIEHPLRGAEFHDPAGVISQYALHGPGARSVSHAVQRHRGKLSVESLHPGRASSRIKVVHIGLQEHCHRRATELWHLGAAHREREHRGQRIVTSLFGGATVQGGRRLTIDDVSTSGASTNRASTSRAITGRVPFDRITLSLITLSLVTRYFLRAVGRFETHASALCRRRIERVEQASQ